MRLYCDFPPRADELHQHSRGALCIEARFDKFVKDTLQNFGGYGQSVVVHGLDLKQRAQQARQGAEAALTRYTQRR